MHEFRGKVAVITGAAPGIGPDLAQQVIKTQGRRGCSHQRHQGRESQWIRR